MNSEDKIMIFKVEEDLHDRNNSPVYEVVIDLKNKVSDSVREWAINIAGTAVRNYCKENQGLKNKADLISYIKNALGYHGLKDNGFEAIKVNVKEKENKKTRA